MHMDKILREPVAMRRPAAIGRHAIRLGGALARRHRVAIVGDGPELVVFSHGFGTDQSAWSAICPQLADRATCILYDLPGAGPWLPDDFDAAHYGSIGRYADDLLALLDELQVERCAFVGHSVSGMVGALASIEDPARFSRLVLLNASPRYLDGEGYRGGFDRPQLEGLFEAMARNYHGWVAGFAPMAVPEGLPDAVTIFADGLLAMRPDVATRISRMIFESDVRALLPLVTTPTTLIHSNADVAVPAEVADYLKAHIVGAELVRIDAGGHLPHLSAPDIVLAALRACLG
jgi:sigma-B regulation protein RsbQ